MVSLWGPKPMAGLPLQGTSMATPKEMDVVRRAYELWQQAGEPSGKDDEF
jgi:hypothetical protein